VLTSLASGLGSLVLLIFPYGLAVFSPGSDPSTSLVGQFLKAASTYTGLSINAFNLWMNPWSGLAAPRDAGGLTPSLYWGDDQTVAAVIGSFSVTWQLVGTLLFVAVALFAFIGDHSLDRRAVWNSILPDTTSYPDHHFASCDVCELAASTRRPGDHCPRCGSRLDRNLAPRFVPAAAAVAAAIPLCIPAYSAAIIVNSSLTGVLENSVVGTVQFLADRGYWQYGSIILLAGVGIPAVELLGLIWLLLRVGFPSTRGLVTRTRVYRILRRLVRWPMIIPFVAAIAAPIVNFRGIDDIVAGPGATPLFMIIALLMLAVRLFEPRMMWKTAGQAP